jgi:hypothetical protein
MRQIKAKIEQRRRVPNLAFVEVHLTTFDHFLTDRCSPMIRDQIYLDNGHPTEAKAPPPPPPAEAKAPPEPMEMLLVSSPSS